MINGQAQEMPNTNQEKRLMNTQLKPILARRLAKKGKKVNGFTMIELMIGVAIVGTLSAVALPQLTKAQNTPSRPLRVPLQSILQKIVLSQLSQKLLLMPTLKQMITLVTLQQPLT